MSTIKVQFGGYTPDPCPTRTLSGTADIAKNVMVVDGALMKRYGFAQVADKDATMSDYFIKDTSTTVNQFYELADGLYLGDTKIVNAASTAVATGAGWWYVWNDVTYKCNATACYIVSGSSKGKFAGLPQPATAPTISATGAGEKGKKAGADKGGYYHVYLSYRNSATGEEGIVTDTPAFQQCTVGASTGAISITNWTTINAAAGANDAGNYVWDQVVVYCSLGDTEYVLDSAKNEREVLSYIAYEDTIFTADHGGAGSATLNKADHVLRRSRVMSNTGGKPPACTVGCFTGRRAIYISGGSIYYSIPGIPTMVPQEQTYGSGGDAFLFRPSPYTALDKTGISGTAVGAASGGGVTLVCTQNKTYLLREDSAGRIYPILHNPGVGLVYRKAIIGTPHGVFGIGLGGVFWQFSGEGWKDLSKGRFASAVTSLGTTPVIGYYAYKDQVWIAGGGGTGPVILVWDIPEQKLFLWEIAAAAAEGTVVGMGEFHSSGTTPKMYLGLGSGVVLGYPGTRGDMYGGAGGTEADFACEWRGYFAQERIESGQRIIRPTVMTGGNCNGKVTVGVRAMQSPKQTIAQTTRALTTSNDWEPMQTEIGPTDAHLFQVDITSAAQETASTFTQWTIHDFLMSTDTK